MVPKGWYLVQYSLKMMEPAIKNRGAGTGPYEAIPSTNCQWMLLEFLQIFKFNTDKCDSKLFRCNKSCSLVLRGTNVAFFSEFLIPTIYSLVAVIPFFPKIG